jgi:hypothetical protein
MGIPGMIGLVSMSIMSVGESCIRQKFDDWSDPGYLGIPSPVVNKTMLAPAPIDVPPFFAARISLS